MSMRQLPKMALGTITLLLLATGLFILSGRSDQEAHLAQIRLAQDQPGLLEELAAAAAGLEAATNLVEANQQRYRLGDAVVRFDRVLASLSHGGHLEQKSGQKLQVGAVGDDAANALLEEAARSWVETGVPLADLAAEEFSVFSAAGQEALRGLEANQAELASLFRQTALALEQSRQRQQVTLAYARWLALALAGLLLAMGWLARRAGRPGPPSQADTTPAEQADQPAVANAPTEAPRPAVAPGANWTPAAAAVSSAPLYDGEVDFENLNASVDNISVDLGTIASHTEKMHQAIESVSHGMQGLLFSLKEMAAGTAEDSRILHNANNAAGFTTEASAELADSARQMSKVVDKVTQLALRTKQIAGSLEVDSIQLDPESDTHTSVVAAEIQQLAQQTAHATGDIELTVSTILTTARLYDEAIGQVIKNISKINQISQNLGCLVKAGPPVLAPPTDTAGRQPVAQIPLTPTAQVEPVEQTPPPAEPQPEPDHELDNEPAEETADPGITDELSEALSAIKEVQEVAPELNREESPAEADQAEPPAEDPESAPFEAAEQSAADEEAPVLDTAEEQEPAEEIAAQPDATDDPPGESVFIMDGTRPPEAKIEVPADPPAKNAEENVEGDQAADETPADESPAEQDNSDAGEQENPNVLIVN